tara:strand:- start:16150 stop:17823 length:1674 start_codon:yes stop_codon:yes gene_type:complete
MHPAHKLFTRIFVLPAPLSMVSSFTSSLQRLFSFRYLLMGLVYTFVFHAFWLVSREFETVTATVSWYLPAGIRLAAFLVCPYRAWPALVISEKLTFFTLFSPGAALDESAFMSGSFGWLIAHSVLSPAAVMVCVWLFRKYNRRPFFNNVNSVLSFLLSGVALSALLGLTFLGRRAMENTEFREILWPVWFDFILGDFVGILVLTPIVIVLLQSKLTATRSKLLLLLALLWVTTLFSVILSFRSGFDFTYQLKYIAILPALFFAYRFGMHGGALATLLIGLTAFVASLHSNESPLAHQFYIVGMSITVLILGAAVEQSQQMTNQLLAANKNMEEKNRLLQEAINDIQALSNQLVATQEAERKRLSRDLHDDFGHRIVDLQLQLGLVASRMPAQNNALSTITCKLDELYSAMKQSIGRLRPAGIDNLPLEHVLRNNDTLKSMQRAGVHCQLHGQGTPPSLSDEVRINVYRIIQEALANIAKHADATEVEISITYAAEAIHIEIADNGIGLIQPQAKPSSLGLISMRERARFIGAQLTFDSGQQQGTRVIIDLPLTVRPK